ncbi:MAG: hypothetical protein MUC48_10055 [Leptolyngbya sp. Prado105]|nr:hypothetical protein [Leptolyngbya sp. Prado105]
MGTSEKKVDRDFSIDLLNSQNLKNLRGFPSVTDCRFDPMETGDRKTPNSPRTQSAIEQIA